MKIAVLSAIALLTCLIDLRADGPSRWEKWAARPELAPQTAFASEAGEWIIRESGGKSRHGGWELHWDAVDAGEWHRFEIECQTHDIDFIPDNVHVEFIWWAEGEKENKIADWAHAEFQRRENGRANFVCETLAPGNAVRASARLALRWTDKGKLVWSEPNLEKIEAPAPRIVKAAIATGNPPGTDVKANLDFAIELVGRAARQGADVVCLPEVVLSWKVKSDSRDGARSIPGRETDLLCEAAKAHGLDIALSMNELDEEGLIYNTGLYIDAGKGITGKYRKVHLAVGERRQGKTPGNDFPVWETGYGKVGMLICYDSVHPEGHRILAKRGAEVIFLPIMGDPRAQGEGEEALRRWMQIMSVRAMDNQVWMVICQNRGERGVIIRPDGKVVVRVDAETGLAMAEIDLNFRWKSWIGSDYRNRTWGERRPNRYGELIRE